MNTVEKLVQRYVSRAQAKVSSGDFVSLRPAHVMTHDNSSAVMSKFKGLGSTKIADPRQPVFTLDHNVQDKSDSNLKKYRSIQDFAQTQGIDFYPAGRGIGHQVMVEEGYAFPGTLVVASDSHSNMYGGIGCLGTPVVRTDAASIWATSKTWWKVPPVTNVILEGNLRPGVTGKDIIITLCGLYNKDEVLNHAIEFTGPGVKQLSIDERLCISNMTTEWGALCGVFPVDETLFSWLKKRADYLAARGPSGVPSDPLQSKKSSYRHPRVNSDTIRELENNLPTADKGARYAKTIRLNLDEVTPHVSGPNHVKVFRSLSDMEKENVKVHKAYIVSCVNSRVNDLTEAARVMQGKKVAEGVKLYIAPASSEVLDEAKKQGAWQTLLAAGAIELPAGCGPCIGLGTGTLEDGEVGISATNRNFKGRMGSPNSQAYLASPAVVAASAIAGKIVSPTFLQSGVSSTQNLPAKSIVEEESGEVAPKGDIKVDLIKGFPQKFEGNLIFCNQDNINTDGIYPGKYTYKDDVTKEEQGKVAMENYDPNFNNVCQTGDVLVSGFNFGTGSSREQAATCFKHKGLPVLLAGSLNATYSRNAFNNGFLALESAALVNYLRSRTPATGGTVKSGKISLDLTKWEASVSEGGKTAGPFPINPVGEAAQELIVTGGLEEWIVAQTRK